MLNSDDLKVSLLIELCEILEVSPAYFFNDKIIDSNNELLKKVLYNISEQNARLNETESYVNRIKQMNDSNSFKIINLVLEKYEYVLNKDFKNIDKKTKSKIENFIEKRRSSLMPLELIVSNFDKENNCVLEDRIKRHIELLIEDTMM
jgi:hypothetical protein